MIPKARAAEFKRTKLCATREPFPRSSFFIALTHSLFPAFRIHNSELIHNFFGYPTVCTRMIFCSGRSFMISANAARSTLPRTTVTSHSEAQKR